ncbi:hypothetical protein DMB42_11590 [Nonomuraea sp. WAC 01424]|uniref:hypothetical protein n=1 Tax=Nonomuraea sp. WAC 01424 TaxID=2203200 RepID=UPI000F7A6C70|nr:hypothetical protein [Nonomuraea sp. WAC 01424]RSN12814.1 hypothetical protein DMB42_11590 [Nonomuraea sp. WAC 01424]
MTDLPKAITRDQAFWAAIADRQDQTNQLLAQLLDRFPPKPASADSGTVELREPATESEAPKPPARRARKTRTVKETG